MEENDKNYSKIKKTVYYNDNVNVSDVNVINTVCSKTDENGIIISESFGRIDPDATKIYAGNTMTEEEMEKNRKALLELIEKNQNQR